jgi:fermentation-respiration switch protein FrsA (DUF1100 family)
MNMDGATPVPPEARPYFDRERFEHHLRRSEYYPYPGPPASFDVAHDRSRAGLREIELRFESPLPSGRRPNDAVTLRYFAPLERPAAQAVVFLHGFGFARLRSWDPLPRALASRGFPTLSVSLPFLCERTPPGARPGHVYMSTHGEVALPAYEQAVADIRASLHWLLERSPYARDRLPGTPGPAVLGVSIGAFLSVIVAALEPRFESVVPLLGGGDLDIIVFRGGYRMSVRRELDEARITRENRRRARLIYQEHLEAVRRARHPLDVPPPLHYFLFDPLTFASCLRATPVLMVNGVLDPIIPRAAARQLWLELGEPEILWLIGTHWVGGPWKPFVVARVVRFLRGLAPGARRTPAESLAQPWIP